MGVDIQDPVRLEIEIPAAVRNHVVLVKIRFDGNAVGRLFEQIDRRSSVKREHSRLHGGGQPGGNLVEREQHVDRLRFQPRHHCRQPGQLESEELARKHEVLAQEIESAKNPVVVRKTAHPLRRSPPATGNSSEPGRPRDRRSHPDSGNRRRCNPRSSARTTQWHRTRRRASRSAARTCGTRRTRSPGACGFRSPPSHLQFWPRFGGSVISASRRGPHVRPKGQAPAADPASCNIPRP